MSHNLLSIDQSSHISGWAFFKDGKLEEYGKIQLEDNDLGVRLNKLRDELTRLILDFDINEVAFEDIYMDGQKINNVATFKILAEVFGICDELFTDLNVKHTAVLAGTWKSTLNIKGKTRVDQKRNAAAYVLNTYGITVIQDIADAICIGAHILQNTNSNDGFSWE